ncbi:MAG: ABC-F family ATP-binding cassette domain-containing protein [Erysipelotrichales bacterium]
MLISLKDIYIEYNNRVILDNINFNVTSGDKIGLIGNNGAGKSTLLRQLASYRELDSKNVMYGNNIKVSYLIQDTYDFNTDNILEYVVGKENGLHNEDIVYKAKMILNKLDIIDYDVSLNSLSGGQKKRVALAKALLLDVDLILLDEPTNHLDSNMIIWLENYLKRTNCALVMVTHDRYFLENVCNKIIEVEQGNLIEYPGNYGKYLELKAQRIVDENAKQRKHKALLKKEYEWIMQGPKARSTKNRNRVENYAQLKEEDTNTIEKNLELSSMSSRLGKKILEISDLKIGYDNKILIDSFSYIFKRSDRIGLLGVNGSGKSTLLNVLAKQKEPLEGQLDYGQTLKIGYFRQDSNDLIGEQRVIDYIRDKAEYIKTSEGKLSASTMLEKFLFDDQQQYTIIDKLSGGEKRRLLLLGVLMQAPNFLILDEPTNDLDINTLTIFEDYLENFNGVVLVVSHDRYFMDKIVNSLWNINNGSINFSNDDYSSYLLNVDTKDDKKEEKKKEYKKTKKIRFSYMEEKEFASIDGEIEEINNNLEKVSQEMQKAGDNFEVLNELLKQQEELNEELEMKELRWLELNEKKELIENQ